MVHVLIGHHRELICITVHVLDISLGFHGVQLSDLCLDDLSFRMTPLEKIAPVWKLNVNSE